MTNTHPLVVALHGATGTQGTPVARRLLRDGYRVRAVVRHPERADGCEPYAADLARAGDLARAYAGADVVVVQLPLVFDETAIVQAEQVADALQRSGVRRVVASLGGPTPPGPVGIPYLDARTMLVQALEAGPFAAAIVEPLTPYMDNLGAPWSAPLVRDGVLAYPLPAEAPVPWVALDDVADRIVAAVTDDEQGRLPICGPEPLTGEQTAAALARALARPVRWKTVGAAEYGEMMRPHTGDEVAAGVAGLYAALAQSPRPPAPDPALVHVGRTDLESWARGRFGAAGALAA